MTIKRAIIICWTIAVNSANDKWYRGNSATMNNLVKLFRHSNKFSPLSNENIVHIIWVNRNSTTKLMHTHSHEVGVSLTFKGLLCQWNLSLNVRVNRLWAKVYRKKSTPAAHLANAPNKKTSISSKNSSFIFRSFPKEILSPFPPKFAWIQFFSIILKQSKLFWENEE